MPYGDEYLQVLSDAPNVSAYRPNINPLAPPIVRDLLAVTSRRREAKRRYQIMVDDTAAMIEAEIQRRFAQRENRESMRRFLDASCNAMTAIVRRLATVYSEPPRRTLKKSKADTRRLGQLVDIGQLDITMEEVNRFALAQNVCFTIAKTDGDQIAHEIIRADQCEVEAASSHRLRAMAYELDDGVWYVDEWQQLRFNSHGDPLGAPEPHWWGRVPVTVYRRCAGSASDFWQSTRGADLVSGFFDQIMLRSWANVVAYNNAWKALARKPDNNVAAGSHGTAVEIPAGPWAVMDGDLSVLDLSTDPEAILRAADRKFHRLAAAWNVAAEVVDQSKTTSGLERLMTRSGLAEARREQQKMFRPADRDQVACTAVVAAIAALPNALSAADVSKLDPRIDYQEPRLVESPKEKRETLKAGTELGVDSPVDLVMDQDPDIQSREEALEVIERNLKENAVVLEARKKYNQPAQLAEEQGAEGGRLSGVARDNGRPEWAGDKQPPDGGDDEE